MSTLLVHIQGSVIQNGEQNVSLITDLGDPSNISSFCRHLPRYVHCLTDCCDLMNSVE